MLLVPVLPARRPGGRCAVTFYIAVGSCGKSSKFLIPQLWKKRIARKNSPGAKHTIAHGHFSAKASVSDEEIDEVLPVP